MEITMQEFEYRGVWWVPGFPKNQVAGILKFHPVNGTTLELIGGDFIEAFQSEDSRITHISGTYTLDMVCGYTNKGRRISLHKCRNIGNTWATNYISSKLNAQTVFIGAHFNSSEELKFNKIRVRYSNLEEWLGMNGIIRESNNPGNIDYIIPDLVVVEINNFKVNFTSRLKQEKSTIFEVNMKHVNFVEILSDQPVEFSAFRDDFIFPLRNFFSLAVRDAVYPTDISAEMYTEETGKQEIVEVFFSNRDKRQEKVKDWVHIFFDYQDIGDDLQIYLQNWFEINNKLQVVMDLYFSAYYISAMYIHVRILTLTQALEAYHRIMYGGFYMEPDKYQRFFEEMTKHIPVELDQPHRSSLKSRLKYGYEFSLRKRLTLILNNILAPYGEIRNRISPNFGDFVQKAVDTRNYLTHYSEDEQSNPVKEPKEQIELIKQLDLLMRLCFLKELGFTKEKINTMIERKSWNWGEE